MTNRTRAAALTAAYYAVIFAALGAHLPYWPVWLQDRGLDASQIGLLLAVALWSNVALQPLIGAALGVWVLDEVLEWNAYVATLLILGGVAVVNDPRKALAALWIKGRS